PDMVGKYIPDKNMGWVKRTFDEDGTVFLDVVKTLVGTLVSGFSTPIYSEDGKQVGLLRGVIVTTQENTILSTILDS
ncbi:MAG: hypothetical protein GWO23_08810, partial [Gammaproteobacteria bacterium]|nr:hypothetical protein [Gammaproteobacteria bacterium]NIW48926.1 hypothetical protein [Gammaproteobacteria bacterium]NIX58887.1 hypothetical protein [candidate division Zixibacteria bacterium]